MKAPFMNSVKRLQKLEYYAVALATMFCVVNICMTEQKQLRFERVNIYMFSVLSIINILIAMFMMGWVFLRFRKFSINKEVKVTIQRRYIEYLLVFCLLEFPVLFFTRPVYHWQRPKYDGHTTSEPFFAGGTDFVEKKLEICVLYFGVIIAMGRLRDPLVWDKFKLIMTSLFCCRCAKNSSADNIRPAENFLNASLNTELVITILRGIQILAAGSADSIDNMSEKDVCLINQTATIHLEKFKLQTGKGAGNTFFDVRKNRIGSINRP